MTCDRKARWPITSAIIRAGAATALALLCTVALAEEGWEPTISLGPSAPKGLPLKAAVPQPRPASPPASTTQSTAPPEDGKVAAEKALSAATADLETGSTKREQARDYCANIADPAADARFAWQKKTLADMEKEIEKRIALLEEKTAEYQKWLARRNEFSRKANETVLRIYARMRPDAAAAQLAALDGETAASVLTKLEPRIASLILNEMEPSHAVRLTATISGAGKVAAAARPKTSPEAKAK